MTNVLKFFQIHNIHKIMFDILVITNFCILEQGILVGEKTSSGSDKSEQGI